MRVPKGDGAVHRTDPRRQRLVAIGKSNHIFLMLRLTPFLLAVAYGLLLYFFSAWRARRELDERSTLLADPALEATFARLARALGHDRVPVRLYEVDPINGLASADGRIFLTRGFYTKFREGAVTAEELASVVAHELGHVALGHTRRRMIDFTAQNAFRAMAMIFLPPFLRGAGFYVVNLLVGLVAARLSRDAEYEADAYAAALLTRAGIGTEPQKSLFRKLGRLTGSLGSAPAWLLSHPKIEDRIAAIERMEARWETSPAIGPR
jgi:putative metalloprotease